MKNYSDLMFRRAIVRGEKLDITDANDKFKISEGKAVVLTNYSFH